MEKELWIQTSSTLFKNWHCCILLLAGWLGKYMFDDSWYLLYKWYKSFVCFEDVFLTFLEKKKHNVEKAAYFFISLLLESINTNMLILIHKNTQICLFWSIKNAQSYGSCYDSHKWSFWMKLKFNSFNTI